MTNFNDAKITSLYVSEAGAIHDIEDDAPNAPSGGKFRMTLEMVAGDAVLGTYELIITCTDVTDCAVAPALKPAAPLNGTGTFQALPWKHDGLHWVFNESVTVDPPKVRGHVYRLTAAVCNSNNQIVSSKQSETFVLISRGPGGECWRQSHQAGASMAVRRPSKTEPREVVISAHGVVSP